MLCTTTDALAAIQGITLGFVFDRQVHGIRPIVGIPGAAVQGEALRLGVSLADALRLVRERRLAASVAQRSIREVMAQVGQRADDAVVTPARVLASEANHQLFHRGFYPGSARIGTASGTIELAGNQPPIPPQDGVRLGCAGHLQFFAPKSFSDLAQCAPLRIGELESGRQVCSQDAVLGGQVLILQQQLLIDEARHKGQRACPIDAIAHVAGSS
jgi:hypothetical protein